MAYLKGGAFGCAGYRSLCFSFWKRFISCAGKAIQSSEMLNIIICFAFSALKQWRNSWLSGRLKSWNSANRGVRNNHTKPTIKPVYRLGKLAEFLDKSRWDDRKSNKTRWTKSTTRVLLSRTSRVRIAPGSPFFGNFPVLRARCCKPHPARKTGGFSFFANFSPWNPANRKKPR